MIVVDASVAVKWFVQEEGHESALALLDWGVPVIAPDLVFSETANVLWKKLRRGEVTSEQAARACRALPEFFHGVVSTDSLIEDALTLATRLDHPVYDCTYLVCAQQQGAKLVTADTKLVSRLQNAGLAHLVSVLDEAPALVGASDAPAISAAEVNRVLGLSDEFRRTLSFVEDQVGKPLGVGKLKVVHTADLTPAFESPSHRRLQEAISALARDSLTDLVALAWLGRGYDGSDWTKLRNRARDMLGANPLQHLGYITSLLSYVQAGMQRLAILRRQSPDQPDTDLKPEN